MKISKLIEILNVAQKDFGNVDVKLIDAETGDYNPIIEIIKLHPFTGGHGCMNRNEPVNTIAFMDFGGNSPDLVLNKK